MLINLLENFINKRYPHIVLYLYTEDIFMWTSVDQSVRQKLRDPRTFERKTD